MLPTHYSSDELDVKDLLSKRESGLSYTNHVACILTTDSALRRLIFQYGNHKPDYTNTLETNCEQMKTPICKKVETAEEKT